MFKTAMSVYKFVRSGYLSYFGQSLSLSCCSYTMIHGHPDYQYLAGPPLYKHYYKLQTNGKQIPAFPIEVRLGFKL